MAIDPASSNNAPTRIDPRASPAPLGAEQHQGANAPVGRGAHAPAAPPPPAAATKSPDAKTIADRLVKNAIKNAIEAAKTIGSVEMEPLWSLDKAYFSAKGRPDVQREMLANPDFRKALDGIAKNLFDRALKEKEKDSRFCAGEEVVQVLLNSTDFLHPDVAGALVVSSTPLFVQYHKQVNGPIFSSDKRVIIPDTHKRETYVEALGRSLGSKNPDVIKAIALLQTMVGPSPR